MFLTKKYNFTMCDGCVWVVIGYILFKKNAFNGLLKVIGIQKFLLLTVHICLPSPRHLLTSAQILNKEIISLWRKRTTYLKFKKLKRAFPLKWRIFFHAEISIYSRAGFFIYLIEDFLQRFSTEDRVCRFFEQNQWKIPVILKNIKLVASLINAHRLFLSISGYVNGIFFSSYQLDWYFSINLDCLSL